MANAVTQARGRAAAGIVAGLVWAAGAASLAPRPAHADVLTLHDLLGRSSKALDILLAEAEFNSAQAELDRTRAENGWKLAIQGGYGSARDIVDEARTRSYEAIQTKVSVTYPLLGAYAREQREEELAAGKVAAKKIKRDAALKVAQLHLEDLYAAYWGAQEGIELADAYLATASRYGSFEEDGYAKAKSDRARLERRRKDAQTRLEQLVAQPLGDLTARPVQLPAMPALDVKRLQQEYPELAALRAEYLSLRHQLDDAIWWGVDASFDITQTTVTDRNDDQAGNGVFANFNVQVPLSFYNAGLYERRRLRAEMEQLELQIKQKSDQVAADAQGVEGEHQDLVAEVDRLTTRTQALGKSLRRDASGKGGGDEALARRLREYYNVAQSEIDARTRFWRSHVEMRSYVLVGAAEPVPEPTGPETSDVGTRLAQPIVEASRTP